MRKQTTCYVIADDIADDKRRTKLHKILLRYGKWMQYPNRHQPHEMVLGTQ